MLTNTNVTEYDYTIPLIHCKLIQGCVYPRAITVYR